MVVQYKMADHGNISPDLIWECVRKYSTLPNDRCTCSVGPAGNNNAYLVNRKSGGGARFSRDPLNLTNKHSRKVSTNTEYDFMLWLIASQYDGFVNDKVRHQQRHRIERERAASGQMITQI